MKTLTLSYYTLVENIRQKIFYVLILFGVVLLAAAGLLGVIGGEQKIRVLKDLAAFATESIALFSSIFISSTFIYSEIENKSIHMIFSRPVKKATYLIGRYLGILSSLSIMIIFMTLLGLLVVIVSGGKGELQDALNVLMTILKIAIITALALFFATITTSKITSMGFTFFFWMLGNFTMELDFLSRMANSFVLKVFSLFIYTIVPHLHKFSAQRPFGITEFLLIFLYSVIYVLLCMAASLLLFRKKEF